MFMILLSVPSCKTNLQILKQAEHMPLWVLYFMLVGHLFTSNFQECGNCLC